MSANPDNYAVYPAVRITRYEPLKYFVNVLICDDWQHRISFRTKLSGIVPIQHITAGVETVVLTVHRVTFGHFKCSGNMHG